MRFCILVFIVVLFAHFSLFAQWTKIQGIYGGNVSCMVSQENFLFVGTSGDGMYRSSNKGKNWEKAGLEYSTIISLVSDSEYLYAGTKNGVFRSSDKGLTWGIANYGIENLDITALAVDNQYIYAGTKNGAYRSLDKGLTWENAGLKIIVNQETSVHSLIMNGQYVYAATNKGIYRSSDKGNNWENIGMKIDVNALVFKENKLYAGTINYGIYVSTDSGSTWETTDLRYEEITSLAADGDNIYASTNKT
ncbi:MAG TPA: hypothetical protein PLW09_01465 [Candidatus Kapabacteria bacterium]|jgi:ligand-binding sensor domain-containing protein|nr:hypothetical protein [Candidatus Kapabacteria bacterium]